MQIKTTLRFYLTPVRIATIMSTNNNKVGEDVRKNKPSHTAGVNLSLYNHYGKQYGSFIKHQTYICHMIQQYHS
jgi:hypothetical protein